MTRRPAEAFHPGETLADELAARGHDAAWLAEQTGYPLEQIEGMLRGERDMSQAFACQLMLVLGTSASFWLNLQDNWLSWRRMVP